MKYLCLLPLFLFLSACATAAPQQMPERFLGWWEPVSRGLGCVGVQIYPDGKIQDICSSDGEVIWTGYYKIIHIANPKEIYLAIYYPASENGPKYTPIRKDNFKYVMVKMEKGYILKDIQLNWRSDFVPDAKKRNNLSPSQLWQDYKEVIGDEPSSGGRYARPL
jgi:hypothetical protein